MPNPFQNDTEVRFSLPEPSRVEITVFDVRGREVARIVNADFPRGSHGVTWKSGERGRTLPAGTYFYRIRAVTETGVAYEKTTRMTIVR